MWVQGMSGGLLAPMTQMMIARAAGKHMARVMGYAALPILLGPILGPVLAGTILQHASWRWLFLVNVPVCLAGIVMAHYSTAYVLVMVLGSGVAVTAAWRLLAAPTCASWIRHN